MPDLQAIQISAGLLDDVEQQQAQGCKLIHASRVISTFKVMQFGVGRENIHKKELQISQL